MQSWCRTWPLNGSSRIRVKTKNSQETHRSLQKFLEPERKPKVIYADNSLEFGKACEDLSWNHCTSTPHRSETNGIAERTARRVKEGTSAVLLQSCPNESWWADSMECYTHLRNVTDLLSDGKTPFERRFGQPFKGPIIPFGSLVEYHPITAKDQSRIHQFGKKVLPGLFLGYDCTRGKFGRVTYWLQSLRSWRRWTNRKSTQKDPMRKRWYFPKKMEILFFQSQMDESNPLEEIRNWEHPPRYGIDQFKQKVTLIFLENQKGLFHHLKTRFRMPVKQLMTFGPCQETSYNAITLDQESNFTRQGKNHSLFHWSTLTYPELHIRIWMSSKKNASMILEISMGQETCLIHGQVSHNLLHWKKNLQKDICGPGWDKREKQLTSRPDHLWPELWKTMGKNSKLKEKQKWSNEKLHLENSRKLRGIYFIDPEDKEFKETIKNARKKLETSVAPAMPCKIMKKNGGSGASNKIKNKTCVYFGSW